MVIVLPFENIVLTVGSQINCKEFRWNYGGLERTEVILHLPKFKMEETIELKQVLVEIRGALEYSALEYF
jgi:serine protease inhibitor